MHAHVCIYAYMSKEGGGREGRDMGASRYNKHRNSVGNPQVYRKLPPANWMRAPNM